MCRDRSEIEERDLIKEIKSVSKESLDKPVQQAMTLRKPLFPRKTQIYRNGK